MFAVFNQFRPDDFDGFLLLLQAFEERLSEDEVIPSAIVNRERWEPLVEPRGHRGVHDTLAVRKSTFTAPPEDTSGGDRGRSKPEHFVFASFEPAFASIRNKTGEGGVKGMYVPISIGPFEQEREHGVAHAGEYACGSIVVCPGHDRNKIQHAEDSLPMVPVHLVERGEREASGEGPCVDGGCQGDEAGEPVAESGTEALREGEEGKTISLRMANVTNLVVPRR